jgi:hypothetical protein
MLKFAAVCWLIGSPGVIYQVWDGAPLDWLTKLSLSMAVALATLNVVREAFFE